MLNASEWNTLIPIIVMFAAPYLAKLGVSNDQLATALGALGSAAAALYAMYSAWNMKRVRETAIVSGHATDAAAADKLSVPSPPTPSGGVGGRDPNITRGFCLAFLIALAMSPGYVRTARAAERPVAIARNQTPAEFNAVPQPGAASTQAGAANALSSAFGDIINFFATDFDDAAKLATEIPGLQDNNGAACWRQMSSIGVLLRAHPLPLTLKAATDFEALRLLSMSINQACSNPACTQVFTDLSNGVAQIGVGIPVPSLTSICAKVPTITPGPAVAVTSAVTTPSAPAGN